MGEPYVFPNLLANVFRMLLEHISLHSGVYLQSIQGSANVHGHVHSSGSVLPRSKGLVEHMLRRASSWWTALRRRVFLGTLHLHRTIPELTLFGRVDWTRGLCLISTVFGV